MKLPTDIKENLIRIIKLSGKIESDSYTRKEFNEWQQLRRDVFLESEFLGEWIELLAIAGMLDFTYMNLERDKYICFIPEAVHRCCDSNMIQLFAFGKSQINEQNKMRLEEE